MSGRQRGNGSSIRLLLTGPGSPSFGLMSDFTTVTQQHKVTHDQRIHLGTQKAIERLVGPADHRLVLINEVFKTIGTPVRSRKHSINR